VELWRSEAQNQPMRVEHRAVSAILTVLLHLLILFALVRVTASGVKPAPPPAEPERSAARLRGAGERTVSVDIRPGLSTSGLVCPGSSYIGVGVTSEPGSERIILVGDDTPASRAGLQRDDIVLNPDIWQDAHKDGARLRLLILRDGVRLALSVQVGKICIG
jgi:predicted metalloprotease with PDZ domain